eukprot:XP_001705661.1 Hypothetical protein GL50803_21889 [Giardia lamblia ATCC 50803]
MTFTPECVEEMAQDKVAMIHSLPRFPLLSALDKEAAELNKTGSDIISFCRWLIV